MEGNIAASLQRALANLELLMDSGYIDKRPARQRSSLSPDVKVFAIGACSACRKGKAKCDGKGGEACSRCLRSETPCEYPSGKKRGRKRAETP
jgi:hypothetical protein